MTKRFDSGYHVTHRACFGGFSDIGLPVMASIIFAQIHYSWLTATGHFSFLSFLAVKAKIINRSSTKILLFRAQTPLPIRSGNLVADTTRPSYLLLSIRCVTVCVFDRTVVKAVSATVGVFVGPVRSPLLSVDILRPFHAPSSDT